MTIEKKSKYSMLGRLALIGTTIIWGSSFVILKNVLESIPVLYVLAIRFTGAMLIMLLMGIKNIKKLNKDYLKHGAVMGILLFCSYVSQTYGLTYTTPGKNAFLTSIYSVLVPFFCWGIYKKRPDAYNIIAGLLTIVGIGLVSLNEDLSINIGELLTIISGVFFALHIIKTDKMVNDHNVILLNVVQFAVVGGLSFILGLFTAPLPTEIPSSSIFGIVYLCVMCTAMCYLLQGIGQKYTPTNVAAIILTLESVFATIVSVICKEDEMSFKLVAGFLIIFIAVLVSETKLSFLKKKTTVLTDENQ